MLYRALIAAFKTNLNTTCISTPTVYTLAFKKNI